MTYKTLEVLTTKKFNDIEILENLWTSAFCVIFWRVLQFALIWLIPWKERYKGTRANQPAWFLKHWQNCFLKTQIKAFLLFMHSVFQTSFNFKKSSRICDRNRILSTPLQKTFLHFSLNSAILSKKIFWRQCHWQHCQDQMIRANHFLFDFMKYTF